jgi:hypothetical protein
MAPKMTFFRVLLWKLRCSGVFKFPPAFWFGFWFLFGAYWALVAIGWISHLGRLIADLAFS